MKFENLYYKLEEHYKGTEKDREDMDLDDDGDLDPDEKKKGNAKRKAESKQHICATKVHHEKYGLGIPLFAEHAEPTDGGHVSWYTVQFGHGTEVINTTDMDILSERSHDHSV